MTSGSGQGRRWFRRRAYINPFETLDAAGAATCTHLDAITAVTPSSDGCEDCIAAGEREWMHLRLCRTCGHVGCCDSSPQRHASAHARGSGHPIVQSYEPGEDWMWCYVDEVYVDAPEPGPSPSHP
ncbi:MAG: UBP-type zinc finger domain-containing protein [Acidimicrobiia bacterium]|nr:UBP-type zinc finger domain-containing protein [Acidimicrobiia bacterium]